MTVEEYRGLIEAVKSGECMVPEVFTLYGPNAGPADMSGIGNVASHLSHYRVAADLIGPSSDVIDIGCGCGLGARLWRLVTTGRVVAVDKRPSIDVARYLYHTPGVEYHEVNLIDGELPGGMFDIVILCDVYEHLAPDVGLRVVDMARGRLKPQGLLLATTPIAANDAANAYHLRHFGTIADVIVEISSRLRDDQFVCFLMTSDVVRGTYEHSTG